MTASSVPVRQGIPDLRENLTTAGIRFVYFSPRNMRRSKPLANKLGMCYSQECVCVCCAVIISLSLCMTGITFDWNCAISLRALDVGHVDPHRAISQYADWVCVYMYVCV